MIVLDSSPHPVLDPLHATDAFALVSLYWAIREGLPLTGHLRKCLSGRLADFPAALRALPVVDRNALKRAIVDSANDDSLLGPMRVRMLCAYVDRHSGDTPGHRA